LTLVDTRIRDPKTRRKQRKWLAFVLVNLDWTPHQVYAKYRRRFGIEVSYRLLRQVKVLTNSRNQSRAALLSVGVGAADAERLPGQRKAQAHPCIAALCHFSQVARVGRRAFPFTAPRRFCLRFTSIRNSLNLPDSRFRCGLRESLCSQHIPLYKGTRIAHTMDQIEGNINTIEDRAETSSIQYITSHRLDLAQPGATL
jgi:hypothetical protein